MPPYLNSAIALLLHEEWLREAERHRRYSAPRDDAGRTRWWRRRRPLRSDHTLAG
jgi:hypothetical protein